MDIKEVNEVLAYQFGILSIIFGFVQPLSGFLVGIFGLSRCNKLKTPMGKLAKKLNITGMIISLIVMFLVSFLLSRLIGA